MRGRGSIDENLARYNFVAIIVQTHKNASKTCSVSTDALFAPSLNAAAPFHVAACTELDASSQQCCTACLPQPSGISGITGGTSGGGSGGRKFSQILRLEQPGGLQEGTPGAASYGRVVGRVDKRGRRCVVFIGSTSHRPRSARTYRCRTRCIAVADQAVEPPNSSKTVHPPAATATTDDT